MKIYSPNKKYCGVSASVTFVNGVGETDNPHLIKWFEAHGYKVEGTQMNDSDNELTGEVNGESHADEVSNDTLSDNQEQDEGGQDFSEMDADMLKAYAEENDIDIGNATTKEGILKKIKATSKK